MYRLLILFAVILSLAACSSKEEGAKVETTTQASADLASSSTYEPAPTPVTVAGVTFRPDKKWTNVGASGMRQAEFIYGPIAGEADSATMTVYYFGPTQGGNVEDNLMRWIGQMSPVEGEPVRTEFEVDSMKAHLVEVEGTYNSSMGGPMSGATEAHENYRMAAVVLETPQGNVFFKLTGPDKTAGEMISDFRGMLAAITSGEAS
jgi:hypothetical protein